MCNERVQNCYSFQSVGADPPLLKSLKCIWGKGGCGIVDFKKGWPGVDSIFFNTVKTHNHFFKIV